MTQFIVAAAQYPIEQLADWSDYAAKLTRWVAEAAEAGAALAVTGAGVASAELLPLVASPSRRAAGGGTRGLRATRSHARKPSSIDIALEVYLSLGLILRDIIGV